MHELGIAASVLEAVRTETARHPGALPVRAGVRVGELSGVNADALAFSFRALTAGTEWERLEFEIECKVREHFCPACDVRFPVVDYEVACPKCGTRQTVYTSGDQLELTYVELEES